MPRVSKELKKITEIFNEEDFIDENTMENQKFDLEFISRLIDSASYIVENRQNGKVLHSLESILIAVIFAIIANCNTFTEIHLFITKHYEWLTKYAKFECGIPSLSTIKRVIGFINSKELEEMCKCSMKEFLKSNKPLYRNGFFVIEDIKTMDGKTANSSNRVKSKNGKIAKMNAMSVYSIKNECCEATEFIDKKTNEIPTGPILLSRINIKDCLITFDALSTQTETINYIVSKEAHYVAPVKGNQSTLEEQIKDYFDDTELYNKAKKESYKVVKEKAHGTCETREYIFTNDIDWLYKKKDWEKIKSIGIAVRKYEDSEGNEVKDTRYYISDLSSDKLEIISKGIRGEWSVENGLHLYLDTVFEEDKNKCFLENSQKNLNIIRKFCLSILKKYKSQTKLSMNSIRFLISMDYENEIKKIISSLYS